MHAEAEGIASQIHDVLGLDPPIDPYLIAKAFELDVRLQPGVLPHVEYDDTGPRTIVINQLGREERRASSVAHELGHALAAGAGLDRDDEQLAWSIARALLMPREFARCALREFGHDVDAFVAVFRVSHEMAARRILDVSGGPLVLWVWDREPEARAPYRVVSPGYRWPRRSPTALERDAMLLALEERAPVQPIGGVRAWPALDPPHVRVLCLTDPEALPNP